jgi:arylsulfatase A-like enzyme
MVSATTSSIWQKSKISGHHSREGIFFAYGPDINKDGGKLKNLKIFDVTPTVLHTFGLPISRDIDGRVLTEIFDEKSQPAKRKIVYQESEETDKVKSRVRGLKLLGKI